MLIPFFSSISEEPARNFSREGVVQDRGGTNATSRDEHGTAARTSRSSQTKARLDARITHADDHRWRYITAAAYSDVQPLSLFDLLCPTPFANQMRANPCSTVLSSLHFISSRSHSPSSEPLTINAFEQHRHRAGELQPDRRRPRIVPYKFS